MSTSALELRKPNGSELATPTPADLLRIAVEQNLDIEKLQKLLDLQLQWEANQARKSFVVAMNAFKADPPVIEKNKEVRFGQTAYRHATLDHVCDAVTKGLSKHGISHRWDVEQIESLIRVTCILTHEAGHSERTTLAGTADTSGSKNSIQAVGSTVTYLQRYTLLAATGLAAANGDNDGTGTPKLDDLAERLEFIANCSTLEELHTVSNAHFKEAKRIGDLAAAQQIVSAKDKRKGQIQRGEL